MVGQIATVAAISVAVRWLVTAKGAELPETHGDTSVYRVKWPWRALGWGAACFCGVLVAWLWHDPLSPASDRWLLLIPGAFAFIGLWLAFGVVTIDQRYITRRFLWHSRSLRWDEITAIQFNQKYGQIVLSAGSRKLKVDDRFDAFKHLYAEITERSKAQPTIK